MGRQWAAHRLPVGAHEQLLLRSGAHWYPRPARVSKRLWCPAVCIEILRTVMIFVHEFLGFRFIDFLVFVWPKSLGGPSDDLGRSFGIIFSPKFQHPTMLVNHFHAFCFLKNQKNMKIELFGHPLNPRPVGTPLGCKSAKFYSG